MAVQKTPSTGDLEKSARLSDKKLEQFLNDTKTKRMVIANTAQQAKAALKSIRGSEKQSASELAKFKTASDRARTAIGETFTEVDVIRDDTRKSYGRFKRTIDAALQGDSGITARKADVAQRHDDIKKLQIKITDLSTQAQEQAAKVTAARTDSAANAQLVASTRERADEIRSEIEKTYHIASDGAMSGALNMRKVEIQGDLKFWKHALIWVVSALVLAIIALIVISTQEKTTLASAFLNRLVYLTPLLFILFITYRQYGHERRLVEEYAFKSAMAQTLRNYAVLLSDNYKQPGAEDKVLKFLLESMANIYDRSSLDATSGFFYQLIVGSKQLGAQATVQEGSTQTKQTSSKKTETTKEQKTQVVAD